VALDSSPEHGGHKQGFGPMELLLVGLGACTGMDVITILRKKRQNIAAYRIEVSGNRAEDYPKVFTEIFIRHVVHGDDVEGSAVRHAIELSETKYCPAYAMLSRTAKISTTYEIHPAGPED
jgi:putative redox protein